VPISRSVPEKRSTYTDAMSPDADLLSPLKRYWGYSCFRPLQERIVKSLIAGHDACVVMPTGGGKSLCYQLPAVVLGRTAVVISPLIALMQDQAAQLAQMGIPAAVLNSSISGEQQSRITRKAAEGGYRLLYLSPERLQRADTVGWLQRVPTSFFAIDEAHCISEWGHEFRPEYRQLSRLRGIFPNVPIAAFTASATRHVRHDILAQLALRDPDRYIASFHRPNLHYLVRECDGVQHTNLLLTALRSHSEGNVIVYSPTINKVEETVDFLGDQGIAAVPYHAKMSTDERRRNQERWMSDEVRVLVGTIAFGLGINKATVRAVIHLSLPKSVEQFYQEAGRAGRDGKPADCILLWQKRDAGLLGHFANQILDGAERDRAWQRYHKIREFAESNNCRHRQICTHFGETPKWSSCGACDVCGGMPEWLSLAVSRETVRKAFRTSARERTPAQAAIDESLREYLREWRRAIAKEQGLPAYVVMHDSTLDEICRMRPVSIAQLRTITGIGERKAELYGQEILRALEQYHNGARAAELQAKASPMQETLELLQGGKTLEEIAATRGRQMSTVINTVATLVEAGEVEFSPQWISSEKLAIIQAAFSRLGIDGSGRLKPLKEVLPPEITYQEIRLVVARIRRETARNSAGVNTRPESLAPIRPTIASH
jgi:ATP-dependent DNA helicase RecQ